MASDVEDLQESYDAEFTTYRPLVNGEGLLPWGASQSGDSYYWRFESSRAVAVVTASRSDFFWECPGALARFLVAWLCGDISPLDQPTIEQLGEPRFSVVRAR
ncbi:hypothetical protein [Streptomyces sp. H39-S7]|uniref:hypothetical protein n=1 Tax=Streptomyces sp. H39-S7 TaxID=3004357 RepID=UPI0022AFB252|nr:hypothetical protein [Streptomyces sp. H39-S7]MCZ4121673.1 hypothetical protein [Streptomyces sp. H39-S7]